MLSLSNHASFDKAYPELSKGSGRAGSLSDATKGLPNDQRARPPRVGEQLDDRK
jgi:hypothetical protein